MLNNIIIGSINLILTTLICFGVSLLLGVVIFLVDMFRNTYTKSFVLALTLIPAMVQTKNLGSLYELKYTVLLKNNKKEMEMLDKIRQKMEI